ncbi:MAG: hypothetical protein GX633_09595 [Clostridiales bacterium]|nr:hypothetical protein [Clostridiales bacterium]
MTDLDFNVRTLSKGDVPACLELFNELQINSGHNYSISAHCIEYCIMSGKSKGVFFEEGVLNGFIPIFDYNDCRTNSKPIFNDIFGIEGKRIPDGETVHVRLLCVVDKKILFLLNPVIRDGFEKQDAVNGILTKVLREHSGVILASNVSCRENSDIFKAFGFNCNSIGGNRFFAIKSN